MARAVEQIERDLAALEQTVTAIAQELQDTYSHYLGALGKSVRQQLVVAAYHLCTQGYPDRFIALSFSQRQDLQQALRQLAQQTQTQLLEQLQPSSSLSSSFTPFDDFLEAMPFEPDSPPDDELLSLSSSSSEPSVDLEAEISQPLSDPRALLRWQEMVEAGVVGGLQTCSHAANRTLQKAEILSNKLPEPILEVAAKAGAETTVGPPNLLNLMLKTDTDDGEESKVTHIMAIRLRLAEIEFADSTLTAWRSKIRGLLARLHQLERDYQKKQRERTIAEAEAAWRSSWFDDSPQT